MAEWQKHMDFMPAQICALLANIHCSKDGKVYSPFDFMPGQKEQKQTPRDFSTVLKQWGMLYQKKEK